eukprot:jgi/Mesvir1/16689/Mv25526-RA.1
MGKGGAAIDYRDTSWLYTYEEPRQRLFILTSHYQRSLGDLNRALSAPAPAQPAAPSSPSLSKDDIRAVLEEHVTWPLAEKLTSLNTTLNTVEARVSNVETRVVHKLQPQFTALHTATQASETHAALVSRLNQVEGKCGVLMKKLEAITAHTEALATQVPKIAEQTATIASQPPRQDAGDLPPLSYADLLRSATASTTDAIATKLPAGAGGPPPGPATGGHRPRSPRVPSGATSLPPEAR